MHPRDPVDADDRHELNRRLRAGLGACALLSASQNAPLMAMCLVMELTEAPMNLFVPVVFISMISLLASHATLSVVERRSVTVLG